MDDSSDSNSELENPVQRIFALVTLSPMEEAARAKLEQQRLMANHSHYLGDTTVANGKLEPGDCGPYNVNCTEDFYEDYINFHHHNSENTFIHIILHESNIILTKMIVCCMFGIILYYLLFW